MSSSNDADDEVLQITRDFRASLPGRVQAMRSALASITAGGTAAEDAKVQLRTFAHKLRGTCGSFGLTELAAPARAVEDACQRADLPAIATAIDELDGVVAKLA